MHELSSKSPKEILDIALSLFDGRWQIGAKEGIVALDEIIKLQNFHGERLWVREVIEKKHDFVSRVFDFLAGLPVSNNVDRERIISELPICLSNIQNLQFQTQIRIKFSLEASRENK